MANFDELNEDNGADAIKSLGQIKVNWDAENPQYFFQKLETELQIFSINKQFTKRQAPTLVKNLTRKEEFQYWGCLKCDFA